MVSFNFIFFVMRKNSVYYYSLFFGKIVIGFFLSNKNIKLLNGVKILNWVIFTAGMI